MIIGCFALIEPFTSMRRQFEAIRELGIQYADLTDNHDGATLGTEFGFSASVSLDAHPAAVRDLLGNTGIQLTSVCAHANLFDPTSPATYGTHEIIKAIRLAHHLGIRQVITTEGEPKTEFGHSLSRSEQLLLIREKLHAPIAWAAELNIELLLEPHGVLSDTAAGMQAMLDALGHERTVGINLDTGNSWLGGGEPLEFIQRFSTRIRHVHWKDLSAAHRPQRGKVFGCGMGTIPLGDGVVGIREIVAALKRAEFNGPTTLEVAGAENVKLSAQRLRQWWSE